MTMVRWARRWKWTLTAVSVISTVAGHVEEVGVELARLGVAVAAHGACEAAVERAGKDEKSHVEVDFEADGGGQGVRVEEADAGGRALVDEEGAQRLVLALRRRGGLGEEALAAA